MSKKEARLNNKKRKLQALAEITKLNETDKDLSQSKMKLSASSKINEVDGDEPTTKRLKQNATDAEDSHSVLSDDDYARLKRELNHKKRELRNIPKLRMKLFGDNALITIPSENRTPIFLTDIQHLIMYSLFGSSSPCIPTRWCHLEKVKKIPHTIVILVDGLSLHHFTSYESLLKSTKEIFEHKLEVIMPDKNYTRKMVNEIMMVPLTNIFRDELVKKYGSLEAAIDYEKNPVVDSVFPVSDNNEDQSSESESNTMKNDGEEIVPRTQLLLSALQMIDEGYPLPLQGELANRYKDFVMTKDKYTPVTAKSPMFGVDCEMCRTSAGVNELTRISVINEEHESIYETLVCPRNKIIDYLTPFSGITPQMMMNVTKTLAEVQKDIRELLPPNAIFVGQSLHSDLMAMRMMHPYVIDTSVIFNISGDRKRKSKLQTLAREFLGESIQKNPLGHDSIEDCSASLKLTKLKLQKGIDFGDAILENRLRQNDRNQSQDDSNTAAACASTPKIELDRSIAVVTSSIEFGEVYEQTVNDKFKENDIPATNKIHIHKTSSNKCAVQKTCEIALNHALVLTHLNIDQKKLSEKNLGKTMKKVDQWISEIYQSAAPNALVAVVFSGHSSSSSDSSSGVAMLQVKPK